MRSESHALFVNCTKTGKTEHLIAAAIGQKRMIPADESMKSTSTLNDRDAGPEIQVVRISEDDACPELFEFPGLHRLDRPLRPNWHEHRRRDLAAISLDNPCPCFAVGM